MSYAIYGPIINGVVYVSILEWAIGILGISSRWIVDSNDDIVILIRNNLCHYYNIEERRWSYGTAFR